MRHEATALRAREALMSRRPQPGRLF